MEVKKHHFTRGLGEDHYQNKYLTQILNMHNGAARAVVKEREKGKVVNINTRIVLGDELQILEILDKSERCKTISTSFVESRNGAYRKDNKRQTRKTKCHSKQIEPHDAHVIFLKSIYNLTKENEKFRILINPDAKPFEIKYKKVSPAMKQGLVQQIYPLEELLLMKPLMFAIN